MRSISLLLAVLPRNRLDQVHAYIDLAVLCAHMTTAEIVYVLYSNVTVSSQNFRYRVKRARPKDGIDGYTDTERYKCRYLDNKYLRSTITNPRQTNNGHDKT